jgi:putative hydrolase of the HAD superfamily
MDRHYHAVVFDLFGTLVEAFSPAAHAAVVATMADLVQLPRAEFAPLWIERMEAQRPDGSFPSITQTLAAICRELQRSADAQRLQRAADVCDAFEQRTLTPKPGAVEMLWWLKQAGYRTGLISNCAADVPRQWQTSPFADVIDVSVLSCEVHLKKPDPRIYHLACERLGVVPQVCLYLGDGSEGELPGAKQVGLSAVLVRPSPMDAAEASGLGGPPWNGPRIASLSAVVAWLQEAVDR